MGQQPYGQLPSMPPNFAQGLPNMPPVMPFPPLGPSDPAGFADLIAAIGFPSLASMPPIPQAASPPNFVPNGGQRSPGMKMPMKNKINARCRDYDTKGYCTRGNACPFEHGNDHMVVHHPDGREQSVDSYTKAKYSTEYDPKNSVMVNLPQTSPINGHSRLDMPLTNTPIRGSYRGRGDRGTHASRGRGRAEFSSLGPNNDRSITSIVVEQIPEEKFDEISVREFFSAFGTITEVLMQPYKHLAIVKYDNYYSARNAYDSPKVIFDNRFVKVYWYNPNTLPTPPANGTSNAGSPTMNRTEEPAFDREEFERNAAAAQKKLEEKKALMEEAKAKKLKLQAEKEELERRQAEEKQKLKDALAAKGLPTDSSETKSYGANGAANGALSSQTEALRAQVAALEAEAKSLGLDTALSEEPWAPRGRGRGRGRGSYRGWEGFAGHANTFDSPRGAYRGRASYRGRSGGTHSLDNRTKKVAVSGVEFDMAKDEALRQFLLVFPPSVTGEDDANVAIKGVGAFEAIDPHPSKPGAQIVAFKDRFTAESFLHGTKDIPGVGKVELMWVNTPLAPVVIGMKDGSGDTGMVEAGEERKEVDYDVAEDDDRWMDEVS